MRHIQWCLQLPVQPYACLSGNLNLLWGPTTKSCFNITWIYESCTAHPEKKRQKPASCTGKTWAWETRTHPGNSDTNRDRVVCTESIDFCMKQNLRQEEPWAEEGLTVLAWIPVKSWNVSGREKNRKASLCIMKCLVLLLNQEKRLSQGIKRSCFNNKFCNRTSQETEILPTTTH